MEKIDPTLWETIDTIYYDHVTGLMYIFKSDYHVVYNLNDYTFQGPFANYGHFWSCEHAFERYNLEYWFQDVGIKNIDQYHNFISKFRMVHLRHEEANKTSITSPSSGENIAVDEAGKQKPDSVKKSSPKLNTTALIIILSVVVGCCLLIAIIGAVSIFKMKKRKQEREKKKEKRREIEPAPLGTTRYKEWDGNKVTSTISSTASSSGLPKAKEFKM